MYTQCNSVSMVSSRNGISLPGSREPPQRINLPTINMKKQEPTYVNDLLFKGTTLTERPQAEFKNKQKLRRHIDYSKNLKFQELKELKKQIFAKEVTIS